jgi:hypothetical protein
VHLTWQCGVGKRFTRRLALITRRRRGSNLFPRLQVHVAVDVFFLLRHRLIAQPPAQHLVDLNQRWGHKHSSVYYSTSRDLLNGEAEVRRLVARGPHAAHDAVVINACPPSHQQRRKRDQMHAPASKLYPLTSSCDDSASVLRPSTALHQRQQRQARMRRSRGSLRGGNCGNLISSGRHLSSFRSTMKGEVFSRRRLSHAHLPYMRVHGGRRAPLTYSSKNETKQKYSSIDETWSSPATAFTDEILLSRSVFRITV